MVRSNKTPEDHTKRRLSTDELIANSPSSVLEQKFTQSAEYARHLERSIAVARNAVVYVRMQLQAALVVQLPTTLLPPLQSVVKSVASPPSLVCPDGDQLKRERSKPGEVDPREEMSAIRKLLALPKSAFLGQPPSTRCEQHLLAAEAYINICKEFLNVFLELRDRYQMELEFRLHHLQGTSRHRDQSQRDHLIRQLQKANPKAEPAELFKMAKTSPLMNEILARGRVKLNSKQIIRNVLNKFSSETKRPGFNAATAEPLEQPHKISL